MGKFDESLIKSAHDTPIFLFLDNNLSKYQGILTKLGTCIDIKEIWAGLGGSVGCMSDWRPEGRKFDLHQGRQHSFVDIDHEIISLVILSLRLIQKGQLSVSGERMCTIPRTKPASKGVVR